ncbi:MAG: hypothetical protein COT17_02980 [Elusimicrobia bacterium CG08_land_8_20_14_0_20_51_18]|nr:MAG: hypothetical protein COT17_02980 [Elusimicrobia bacterium CG08_land_8_20_14_0_20_51_18]
MKIPEKVFICGLFLALAAGPSAAVDDLERSTEVVKIKGVSNVKKEGKAFNKKPAPKKKGKKANYVFEKQDETSYKFNEKGDPMKGKVKKKPAKKTRKKIKDMSKDYKNESKDKPFQTYKFDEEGNPLKKETKKKKTGKEEKIDDSLELGNESKKITVTE